MTKPIRDYCAVVGSFSRNAKLYLLGRFTSSLGFSINLVIFNLYLAEGGYKEGAIGAVLSMFPLATGVLAFPSGILSDRMGRKRCFVLGCCLFGVFLLVRAFTLNYTLLITATFLVGIGSALFHSSHAPFLAESSGVRERTHLFSVGFANSIAAMMLGGVIGGWLPSVFRPMLAESSEVELLSYRAVLVVGAFLYFISLLPLTFIREGRDEYREGRDEEEQTTHQGESVAYKFVVNALLIGLGAGLIVPFFNLYFYRRFDCSTEQIGLFIATAHGMMALAVLTGPILSGRFGKLRAIVGVQLSSLPFLLVLGTSRFLPLSLIAYWVRAALMNTPAPITSNLMMDLLPERRRATVNSLTIAARSLGRALATVAGGWMIQRSGWAAPFFSTALLYAMSSTVFYGMFRKYERMAPRK